jgi:DNA-binding transcriptional LysR family regulator
MIMSLSSIQLDAFLAVTQTQSFTLAAEKLNVSQSALSQRIINLEEEIGTTLFIRERSGLRLTETAHELVRYCQLRNSVEEQFLSKITSLGKEDVAGIIRIGGFSSIMRSVVLPALSPILIKHPKVKLHLFSREIRDLPNLLKQGEIDFMLLDHKIDKEGIERIDLGVEENVLVEKRDSHSKEIYLDHDENDQMTFQYLKLMKKKAANIERVYLDDIYGILDGVRLGLGKAVLPRHLVENEKNLKILYPDLVLKIPVSLYFYTQPYYTKLHHMVIEHLKSNCL